MITLRPYQEKLKQEIYDSWSSNHQNVMAVAPTGAGKTSVFSAIMREWQDGYSISIAHRQEIVGQISLALARNGVTHDVIAPTGVKRMIHKLHVRELGRSWIDVRARAYVAGVQTLIKAAREPWMDKVGLFVCDEGHHCLKDNQWGRAAGMFTGSRGLLVSATPMRADGAGLGRDYDGIVDDMVFAPEMRELIDMNPPALTEYKIKAPPVRIDYSKVKITASGDYSLPELRHAVHQDNQLVGDIVRTYEEYTPGLLGATFAVDIEHAKEIAAAFRGRGIPAEIITGKTDDLTRAATIRRLETRQVLQVVSVDILGEGTDLPALEMIIMGRKTESLALYRQQAGRVLRIAPGKQYGFIHDHVGNVIRHGLPDRYIDWRQGLKRRDRRSKPATGEIPLRTCLNPKCLAVYERYLKACPYCGHVIQPATRSTIEAVDGCLVDLDEAMLAELRGAVIRTETPPSHPDAVINAKLKKDHAAKMKELAALKEAIALYGGWRRDQGHDLAESQKLFFYEFGLDVGTAQTLKRAEAEQLRVRIIERLAIDGIIRA